MHAQCCTLDMSACQTVEQRERRMSTVVRTSRHVDVFSNAVFGNRSR